LEVEVELTLEVESVRVRTRPVGVVALLNVAAIGAVLFDVAVVGWDNRREIRAPVAPALAVPGLALTLPSKACW